MVTDGVRHHAGSDGGHTQDLPPSVADLFAKMIVFADVRSPVTCHIQGGRKQGHPPKCGFHLEGCPPNFHSMLLALVTSFEWAEVVVVPGNAPARESQCESIVVVWGGLGGGEGCDH